MKQETEEWLPKVGRQWGQWGSSKEDFLGRKGPLSGLEQGLHRRADLSRVTEYTPTLCGLRCLQVLLKYKPFYLKKITLKSLIYQRVLSHFQKELFRHVNLSPLTVVASFFESALQNKTNCF